MAINPDQKNQLSVTKIFFIIALVIALFFILVWLKGFFNKADKKAQMPARYYLEALLEGAKIIQKKYEKADFDFSLAELQQNCGDRLKNVEKIDRNFLKCNPDFLQCYFSHKNGLNIKTARGEFNVFLSKYTNNLFYKIISKTESAGSFIPGFGIELLLSVKEEQNLKLKIILENTCSDTFLPRRKYAYGEGTKPEILEWDNLDANIFIDKYLVSNRDVLEWKNFSKRDDIKLGTEESYLPNVSLSTELKNEYCLFRGKKLLQAHIFDAGSFVPYDLTNETPDKIKRTTYFWTKDNLTPLPIPTKESCKNLYSLECILITGFDPYYSNPSWMGMNTTLGGPIEEFNNILEPEKNIKLSSSNFSYKHKFQKLSVRGSSDLYDKKAFRCMSQSPYIVRESEGE